MDSQEDSDPVAEARKKLNTRDMSTLMHRLGETGEIKAADPRKNTIYHTIGFHAPVQNWEHL